MYEVRSLDKSLLRLAGRLESGALPSVRGLSPVMPGELRAVMKSEVSDEAKARVATELMPRLLSGRLEVPNSFMAAFIGPLALCCFVRRRIACFVAGDRASKFKAIFSRLWNQSCPSITAKSLLKLPILSANPWRHWLAGGHVGHRPGGRIAVVMIDCFSIQRQAGGGSVGVRATVRCFLSLGHAGASCSSCRCHDPSGLLVSCKPSERQLRRGRVSTRFEKRLAKLIADKPWTVG